MLSATPKCLRTMILAAFLVALLAAPPFAAAQDEVTDRVSQAITARDDVKEIVELAKQRAQESSQSSTEAKAWASIARAGAKTAQMYSYASTLYIRVFNLQAQDNPNQASKVSLKADQMLERAEAAQKTFIQALDTMEQGNLSEAMVLARNIQSAPPPEAVEEVAAGGPGVPAEEVAAAGPGFAVPPIPDFAPAEVDAPSGVASTE